MKPNYNLWYKIKIPQKVVRYHKGKNFETKLQQLRLGLFFIAVVRYHKGKNFETKLQPVVAFPDNVFVVRYHKGKNFETKLQQLKV